MGGGTGGIIGAGGGGGGGIVVGSIEDKLDYRVSMAIEKNTQLVSSADHFHFNSLYFSSATLLRRPHPVLVRHTPSQGTRTFV